ncbi:MAG: DUF2996 domain-containing protein [Spirulinaceae cyanobacterium]
MPEETKPQEKKAQAAKAKKKKPPAVEDKPFTEFMAQDFTPALQKALSEEGIEDAELDLVKEKLPIVGANSDEQCWQFIGKWQGGKRQFNLYFLDEDIKGQKGFSCASNGASPSTIESFMIDERRVNLPLLVMYTVQRLNGQKWLAKN